VQTKPETAVNRCRKCSGEAVTGFRFHSRGERRENDYELVTFLSLKSRPSMKNERDALKYKEEGV